MPRESRTVVSRKDVLCQREPAHGLRAETEGGVRHTHLRSYGIGKSYDSTSDLAQQLTRSAFCPVEVAKTISLTVHLNGEYAHTSH